MENKKVSKRRADQTTPELDAFEDWMRENGVCWDPTAIEMRACGGVENGSRPHYAVFANRNVNIGEAVVDIPKRVCLNSVTTRISGLMDQAEISGGLALIIAVMFERALGEESYWFPYFQILPQREPLPMFWSKDELQIVKGTDLRKIIRSDRVDMREDWEDIVAPFIAESCAALPWEKMTYAAFRECASLTASRSFCIDSYHGASMVPLADMFNHRTDGEHIHLEIEEGQDQAEDQAEDHAEDDETDDEDDESEGDKSEDDESE
eukprot:CAMPEP_0198197664 /NCGR_PEP_ID=MMETSP1445-20131203/1227_1 /TAXON_ID=36898 /ORGANISM="Pyramimonas sp., Strain CCMP2087" /LENGTH=264 /DNA_ID=CAMNT_0043867001 /DNA_START=195 /DNA_END=986 /DNA_ORIENTATION=-